jgi:hypothetical protein
MTPGIGVDSPITCSSYIIGHSGVFIKHDRLKTNSLKTFGKYIQMLPVISLWIMGHSLLTLSIKF